MDLTEPTNDKIGQEDWPAKASSTVVQYVQVVRNKTTGPALVASRYIVYLIAIALIGIFAAVTGFILLTRTLIVATGELPFIDKGEPWLAYVIVGTLCALIGTALWRKKEPPKVSDDRHS